MLANIVKGFILCIMLVPTISYSQQDTLLAILTEELEREFSILSKVEVPVYYMNYRAEDSKTLSITANFGSLMSSTMQHSRLCQPTVRLGDYSFDNTHASSEFYGFGDVSRARTIPINNQDKAIKQILWRITDIAYNSAKEKYARLKSRDEEKEAGDFSVEEVVKYHEPAQPVEIDIPYWENLAKKLSAVFENEEDVLTGSVYLDNTSDRKYFVSSEGSSVVQNTQLIQIHVIAHMVNENKEVVDLYKSFSASSPSNLPPIDSMLIETKQMLATLKELKNAPYADPYTGPAILHPRAAAVFFHEIFGHRIEGHRLKSDEDGQTFKEKVNAKILPDFINIYSNPTLARYNNTDLNGYYRYDDEGLAARKISIVEEGVLKSFLMSRSPIENFSTSNAHGRSQIGMAPVARQANLIVEAHGGLSEEDLRLALIDECKKQGKQYGYYFKDVTGGFTQTSRYSPNAFNIMPTLVYRIYVDGRPDELVKGVDLIGTPLAMFAEVVAAGKEHGVFNGICGAESGSIPVSAIAPSILVRRIETQKKPVNNIKSEKPILENPQAQQTIDK